MKDLSFAGRMLALEAELGARSKRTWLATSPDLTTAPDPHPLTGSGAGHFSHPGQKHSFVPELGAVAWTLPVSESARTSLTAQIYTLEGGASIGYIRIPHYEIEDSDLEVFRSTILRFNDATDALVLDQVENVGGSLFHAYAVLSHLTDRPLPVPTHEMSFDDDMIAEAEEIAWLADVDDPLDAEEWPTPELIRFSRFVLSEVDAGRGRNGVNTTPGFVFGVDAIHPSPQPYTKPLVVLVNELTFSAPEFLAAIVQDENRGVIFGTRTAGAGGLVRSISPAGSRPFGIESISVTWTLARRANGLPIENYGVHPDIECAPTVDDFRNGFSTYRDTLIRSLQVLLMGSDVSLRK